jgi:hypothetical protein
MAIPDNDDDPTRDDGPVVVRRTIYEAALRFEKTLGPGAPGAIGEAQDRAEKSRDAGKPRTAAKWWAIYRFLMECACVASRSEAIILKPGEKYDYENDRVIKPRVRRPRSGKGGR